MFYVYILQSGNFPEHFYVGLTHNLKLRFKEHNEGKAQHTNKYKPWKIKCYIAFDDQAQAKIFEQYLKTHAGRRFQKRYF